MYEHVTADMHVTSLLRSRGVLPTQHILRSSLLRWHTLCLGDVRNDHPTSLTGDTFTCASSSPFLTNAYIIAYGAREGLSTGERLERYGSMVRLVRAVPLASLHQDMNQTNDRHDKVDTGARTDSNPRRDCARHEDGSHVLPNTGEHVKNEEMTTPLCANTTSSSSSAVASVPASFHSASVQHDTPAPTAEEHAPTEADKIRDITAQLNEMTRLGWSANLYEETQRWLLTSAQPMPGAADPSSPTATGLTQSASSTPNANTLDDAGNRKGDSMVQSNDTASIESSEYAPSSSLSASCPTASTTCNGAANHSLCGDHVITRRREDDAAPVKSLSSLTPKKVTAVAPTRDESVYYWDVVYVRRDDRASTPHTERESRLVTHEEATSAMCDGDVCAAKEVKAEGEEERYRDESARGDVIVAEWRKMKRVRVPPTPHGDARRHTISRRHTSSSSSSSALTTVRCTETNDLVVENGVCFLNARQVGLCVLRMARLGFLGRVEASAKDVMEIPRSAHGGEEHRSLNIVDVSELDFSFSQTALQCLQHMSLQLREHFSLSFVPLTDAAARRATLDTRSRARCVMRADGCAHDSPFDLLPSYHFDVGAYTAYMDVPLPPQTRTEKEESRTTSRAFTAQTQTQTQSESESESTMQSTPNADQGLFYRFDHTHASRGPGSYRAVNDTSRHVSAHTQHGASYARANHRMGGGAAAAAAASVDEEDGSVMRHNGSTGDRRRASPHRPAATASWLPRHREHADSAGVNQLARALSLMRRGATMLVTFVPTPESSAALHAALCGQRHAEVTREAQLIREAKRCVAEAIARTGRWSFITDEVLPAVDAPQGSAISMMIVMG